MKKGSECETNILVGRMQGWYNVIALYPLPFNRLSPDINFFTPQCQQYEALISYIKISKRKHHGEKAELMFCGNNQAE